MQLANDNSPAPQGVASQGPTTQILAPQSPVDTLEDGSPSTYASTQSSGIISPLRTLVP